MNGLNQYASAGPATFGYDANGNLTGDGTHGYGYDIENRLVSVTNGLQLSYDPLGRLYQTSGAASGATQFLYDGDALVAEYDGAGAMRHRYVHSDGADDPLVWYEGAGVSAPRYLYADHQGSVVGVADASGNLISANTYDEYGITRNTATGALAPYGRFGFTGQAWLPDLGMYHYKARVYSPTLGRFLQTDPIGYEDQVNLYAYVANDPLNFRDPSGLCTGSLIENKDGTCKGGGSVNPSLNGAGTSTGSVPGRSGQTGLSGRAGAGESDRGMMKQRAAVLAIIATVCRCRFDTKNIAALNSNFVAVRDIGKLPANVFNTSSASSHSREARETSVVARSSDGPFAIPFVAKLYIQDRANENMNTIAVTSGMGLRHIFDALVTDYKKDNTNLFYANQFCFISDRC